jgi:hypothetical protein
VRSKGVAQVGCQSSGNIDIRAGGVGEKVWEPVLKRGIAKQKVSPEGGRNSIGNGDLGNGTEGTKPDRNVLPNGGV